MTGAPGRDGEDTLAALGEAVAVVDRLVSPGGCPWDAAQTHGSLAPYLVEEAHEAVEAIEAVQARLDAAGGESGDADPGDTHLAEELGDVLLQVLLHARLAQGRGAFDLAGVARALSAKLVRRHPHVFAPGDGTGSVNPEGLTATWERLKAAEAPARGRFEGIPAALPALARAAKVAGRLRRDGLDPAGVLASTGLPGLGPVGEVGAAAVDLVLAAQARGVDAEAALRAAVRALEEAASGEGTTGGGTTGQAAPERAVTGRPDGHASEQAGAAAVH